jgi:hypothetical protein
MWRMPEGCVLRHAARSQFKTVHTGELEILRARQVCTTTWSHVEGGAEV